MRQFLILGSLLFGFILFIIPLAGAQELIIETRDGGQHRDWYTETSGNWLDSVAKSTALATTPNIGSRFGDIDTSPDAAARFVPDIPQAGKYEVFVTWGRSANVYNAKYTVHHSGGVDAIYLTQDGWGYVQQSSNANLWHSLGVYEFAAGRSGYIEVTASENKGKPDPRNLGRLYTDAVKFVPVGPGYVPAATPGRPYIPPPTPVITFVAPPTPAPTPYISASPTPAIRIYATPVSTPTPYSTLLLTLVGINWLTDVEAARAQAQASRKKILVFFYTDRSTYSKKYQSEVFTNPEAINKLNQNYICLKFDLTSRYQEAYMLGAFRAPTFIVYDSMGNPLGKIDEFLTAEQFLTRLAFY